MLPRRYPHSPRFGMIAVKLGYITPTQLRQAMIMQLDDDMEGIPHRLLGDILFDLGWMSAGQRDEVLEKTRKCYGHTAA
ncbi:MAG: hypothetical protein A2X84_05380 [Desulfuromonadaceae bacterium GWC2_58_13]|nr:MAG: hypothetical protein A2X84_05380 [Desulfuromonadaceae bacterium GWC2_58_13]